ncbi:MAG: hypothetical protein SynsKO_07260 [Synoicihabitans sp.]
MDLEPEILFEDADLLVLTKPSGWLSEGGKTGQRDLEQWATEEWGREIRCCHRLDRLTSGVILLRKNRRLLRELAALFEKHQIRKSYWALVKGIWPKDIRSISKPIAARDALSMQIDSDHGKPAETRVRVRSCNRTANYSWLDLLLKTGRRHQARLHCADAGYPILGDTVYGGPEASGLFGLHAHNLRFRHPSSGEDLNLTTSAPDSWGKFLPD